MHRSAVVCCLVAGALVACRDEAPKPIATTAPSASASAAPAPPDPVLTVPGGWRGLKLGMSEADAKAVVLEARKDPKQKWEMAEQTYMPAVRFEGRQLDVVKIAGTRIRDWSIADLDDGAEHVHAWHENGALVAIQVRGKTSPDTFVKKASEAYGGPPKTSLFKFSDQRTQVFESHEVAVWRGGDVTALVWTENAAPVLLLWSNASMDRFAADYRNSLAAPADSQRKAAEQNEKGTKF